MALTGIEIFKKLPKTNCGECGVPTCLAFAMKLAAGQAGGYAAFAAVGLRKFFENFNSSEGHLLLLL